MLIPPLRERPREILVLARAFLERIAATRSPRILSPDAAERLSAYPWPGNVRELKNAIEYAGATTSTDVVEARHLPEKMGGAASSSATRDRPAGETAAHVFRPLAEELEELERSRIEQALEAAGGVQTRAAELIGMPLRTFVLRLKQHGLARPRSR